jgi:Icc protein
MSAEKQKPLLFAHIGDLHITDAKAQNYKDFLAIVAQIAAECGDQLDFVSLPGDNADNGLCRQYQLIAPVLKMLNIPDYILTGDHDMEQGSLDNFYQNLPAKKLPFKQRIKHVDCLFADVCGPGRGRPDFRFGAQQLESLEKLLKEDNEGSCRVLFMHTFPNDLQEKSEQEKLLQLINEHNIVLVDMGHTHYNEIINSGKTIYTATRSTGQIEEGPVGYTTTSVDDGVVSWRFKALDDPFPFVMISSPADYRVLLADNYKFVKETEIRASVLGAAAIKQMQCILEDGTFFAMDYDSERNDWFTQIPFVHQPTMKISVEAVTADGRPGRQQIEIPTPLFKQHIKGRFGTDEQTIGAWPENGLMGTRLGPNRNAKPAEKKKA